MEKYFFDYHSEYRHYLIVRREHFRKLSKRALLSVLFSVCSVLLSVCSLKIPVTRSRTFARSESAMPDMPVGAADIPAVSAQLILARIDQTDRSVQEIIALIDTTVSTAVTAAVTAALQSIEERFTHIETKFEERVQRLEEASERKT